MSRGPVGGGRRARRGPFGQVTSMGVTVIPAWRLPGLPRGLPPTLTPQRAREVAAEIDRRLDAHTGR
jgi:hypothetical protein